MFTSKYRYIFIVLLSVYSYLNTIFSEVYQYYGIHAPWYDIVLLMTVITLLVWEANRYIQRWVLHLAGHLSKPAFLALSFGAGMFSASVISLLTSYAAARWLRLTATESNIGMKLAFTYGTRVNLFMHILNAVGVYINEYKSKQLEAEELKRINAQTQLQVIKNQVNPHFLFNNLNVLSGMIVKDNPDANKFIEEFAKVYRHILSSQDKELVTLDTELEFIRPYVYLLEKRFPESLRVDISIDPSYGGYSIVPAALQMLIENAIKHNVLSRANPLEIKISVNKSGDLIVKNNLQRKPQLEPSTQVGLKNIEQRFRLIAGRRIQVLADEQSFAVVLPLIQEPV